MDDRTASGRHRKKKRERKERKRAAAIVRNDKEPKNNNNNNNNNNKKERCRNHGLIVIDFKGVCGPRPDRSQKKRSDTTPDRWHCESAHTHTHTENNTIDNGVFFKTRRGTKN